MVEKSKEKKETKKKTAVKKESKAKPTQEEFETKVLELAEQGLTSDKIGEKLRKEGIHPKEYKKKISKILKDKGKYVNADLENVEKKLKNLENHYKRNRQDKNALKQREKIFARVRKLRNYFAKKK